MKTNNRKSLNSISMPLMLHGYENVQRQELAHPL